MAKYHFGVSDGNSEDLARHACKDLKISKLTLKIFWLCEIEDEVEKTMRKKCMKNAIIF